MTLKEPYLPAPVNDRVEAVPTTVAVPVDDKLIEDFKSSVDTGAPDDCWPWRRARDSDGYGRFRRTGAHRFALALATSKIPAGLNALHKCNFRACCNPSHLYWGTQADNARDRVQSGRMPKIVPKLDADHVRTIRRMAANGVPHAQIARWFGCTRHHIRSIVNGCKWSSVPDEQNNGVAT